MTLIDALNDSKSRAMIDAIEDTLSSLSAYPNGDKILSDILDRQINELKSYNGYHYKV